MGNGTALVVSAHSADFVWRCGGAIALHRARGLDVTVVCLSYGERGESAKLWKQEGMTLERVKAARREETENAAAALGRDRGDADDGTALLRAHGRQHCLRHVERAAQADIEDAVVVLGEEVAHDGRDHVHVLVEEDGRLGLALQLRETLFQCAQPRVVIVFVVAVGHSGSAPSSVEEVL